MVDTMIRLFESTDKTFLTNGLGALPDASKCEVLEERNGSFELEMEYHISGKRYSDLELRKIIVAKPNPYDDPQPFRIYYISKPMNGLVTIKAEHISYDMAGYPVLPFESNSARDALIKLKNNCITDCPFQFSTDVTGTGELVIEKPVSMRELLGGSDNSILNTFGGEYEFNSYKVTLHANRGSDRGVTIRYGKNMTDLTQEENCSNVYTAVYPYFLLEEDDKKVLKTIDIGDGTVPTSGEHNFTRILPFDVSGDWKNLYGFTTTNKSPSNEEFVELAENYIKDNKLGIPTVSMTVSFEQLSKSKEYETMSLLETVRLCDTVTVEFPKLKVNAKSQCIKTTYNVLTGKYISIELGEEKSNLATTIVSQNESVNKKFEDRPTTSFMKEAVDHATKLISGGLGGYVVLHCSKESKDKHPDEILIMDTDSIETAKKIWRWNRGGLGYSSTGYNGTFDTAITQDGTIVANFVKTGELTANIIKGGTLTIGGLDNTDGEIKVLDSNGGLLIKLSKDGIWFSGEGEKPVMDIIDNTVTAEFVNALEVVAGSVAAENITAGTLSGFMIDGCEIKSESEENSTIINGGYLYSNCIILETIKYSDGSVSPARIMNDRSGNKHSGIAFHSKYMETYSPLQIRAGGTAALDGTKYPDVGLVVFGKTYSEGVHPTENDEYNCGRDGYRWKQVFATNSTINTSDRNEKHDIKEISDIYEKLFFHLKPVSYMFNTGDRTHIGIIAQDLEASMELLGLSDTDIAAFCRDEKKKTIIDEKTEKAIEVPDLDENGNKQYSYGVRYSEFVMLNTHMLQKAYGQIDRQQQEIDELKTKIDKVLTFINERK